MSEQFYNVSYILLINFWTHIKEIKRCNQDREIIIIIYGSSILYFILYIGVKKVNKITRFNQILIKPLLKSPSKQYIFTLCNPKLILCHFKCNYSIFTVKITLKITYFNECELLDSFYVTSSTTIPFSLHHLVHITLG